MIRVSGDNVRAVLANFDQVINHRIIQAANVVAAEPLITRAHRLAPVGKEGNLADSIGAVKPSISRVSEIGEVRIGPRRGGSFKGNHGHLVEFGTQKRSTKSGANRGTMPATPFMQPAFEQTKTQVLDSINRNLAAKVTSYIRRTLKTGRA